MDNIKVIQNFEQIKNTDELINLIQKQMEVIGGNSDSNRIESALKNALRSESRSVLFFWSNLNHEIGAFAFSNICSGLETGGDYLWINELFVDEPFRHKGIASEILQFIENWSKEKNIKYVACTTGLKNEPAQKLYRKKAFQLDQTLWVGKEIE